jgi:hypothetical protein
MTSRRSSESSKPGLHFEAALPDWQPSDTAVAHGNIRYRVTAVVPVARIEEFVDGAEYGVLEVEPS